MEENVGGIVALVTWCLLVLTLDDVLISWDYESLATSALEEALETSDFEDLVHLNFEVSTTTCDQEALSYSIDFALAISHEKISLQRMAVAVIVADAIAVWLSMACLREVAACFDSPLSQRP